MSVIAQLKKFNRHARKQNPELSDENQEERQPIKRDPR